MALWLVKLKSPALLPALVEVVGCYLAVRVLAMIKSNPCALLEVFLGFLLETHSQICTAQVIMAKVPLDLGIVLEGLATAVVSEHAMEDDYGVAVVTLHVLHESNP